MGIGGLLQLHDLLLELFGNLPVWPNDDLTSVLPIDMRAIALTNAAHFLAYTSVRDLLHGIGLLSWILMEELGMAI